MADTESQQETNLSLTEDESVDGSSPVTKQAKNPRAKSTHPPTSEMVVNAITSLSERGGSSIQAIKKYIAATYIVDVEKMAPFIKKFLKSAIALGTIIQTKGKGATGSFKMPKASTKKSKRTTTGAKTAKARATAVEKTPPVKTKKAATAASPTAGSKKKTTKAKKSPKVTEKKEITSTNTTATTKSSTSKPKAALKTKKTTKSPTAKPKVPKPKTVKKVAVQKSSPKKKGSPKKKQMT